MSSFKKLFISFCLSGLLLNSPASACQTDIQVEPLLQSTSAWDGTAYTHYPSGQPQISMVKITIPPHTKMHWHTHPVPNAGYLLSGEITVETKEGKTKHFVAGQPLPETVDVVHRGVTGASEAVILVFYAGAKGLPLSKEVQ